jgi:2-polyprenyl-6-methoxyphenol hydroxylase-like FAD-dependent oxidoreductase
VSRARVLVVGAGVAGLAAARTLARASFAVDVVERETVWSGGGAGTGNAVRALRAFGLGQAALARGVVVPRQQFSNQRGQPPASTRGSVGTLTLGSWLGVVS